MSGARGDVDGRVDGEVGDEERLAAALAVLALTRTGSAPVGPLARWRAQRLAALRRSGSEITPPRSASHPSR
jgi:hypothetical protein